MVEGPLRGGHNLFSCGSKCLDIPEVHLTPSGDRGETTRMFSTSKTHPCLQVSGARQTLEPSMSRAGLSDKAGVSYLPESQAEIWR